MQVLTMNVISPYLSKAMKIGLGAKIDFCNSDAIQVYPHDNDLMVIIVQYDN